MVTKTYSSVSTSHRLVDTELYQALSRPTCTITRGHSSRLQKISCRIDATKYFFTNRIHDAFNDLPCAVFDTDSLALFKKTIRLCKSFRLFALWLLCVRLTLNCVFLLFCVNFSCTALYWGHVSNPSGSFAFNKCSMFTRQTVRFMSSEQLLPKCTHWSSLDKIKVIEAISLIRAKRLCCSRQNGKDNPHYNFDSSRICKISKLTVFRFCASLLTTVENIAKC
jgi:hypothetical protein